MVTVRAAGPAVDQILWVMHPAKLAGIARMAAHAGARR
jgi:hypothetical protein